jgi:hypothetical protein
MRRNIKNLERVTRHRMGRLDQLLDVCEGDRKPCPQTFEMDTTILVNEISKPYYCQFVSPRFPEI